MVGHQRSIILERLRRRSQSRDTHAVKLDNKERDLLLGALYHGSNSDGISYSGPNPLDPYIEFLCTRLAQGLQDRSTNLHLKIQFFTMVVKFFAIEPQDTIANFVERRKDKILQIFPCILISLQQWTRQRVSDTVLCISLWTLVEQFRTSLGDSEMRWNLIHEGQASSEDDINDGNYKISDFARVAGLLPQIADWVRPERSRPGEEIPKRNLNARLVQRIGRVKINWTFDISEHLRLDNGTLQIFCMPCTLMVKDWLDEKGSPAWALNQLGFKQEYAAEVLKSYVLFFGPYCKTLFENLYARDDFPKPKDPRLVTVCLNSLRSQGADKRERWAKTEFQFLWPRITELEQYVREIQADSFVKVLWRDRRDSYGWYTFIFALLVLILTFISTTFTGVQAIKTFYPSNPPTPITEVSAPTATVTTTHEIIKTVTTHTSSISNTFVSHPTTSVDEAPSSTSQSSSSTSAHSHLSAGAITGISIGAVAAFIGILSAVYVIWLRRRRIQKRPQARKHSLRKSIFPARSKARHSNSEPVLDLETSRV